MRILLTVFALLSFSILMANNPENGKVLFTKNCKACHNITKNLVGPALKDIHKRRSEEWIRKFIKASQSMIEAGDTTAIALFQQYNQVLMPDQPVNDQEIDDILSYIVAESELADKPIDNPIKRPVVTAQTVPKPISFGDFRFWIIYTITIIVLFAFLYIMTEMTSIAKLKNAELESEQ